MALDLGIAVAFLLTFLRTMPNGCELSSPTSMTEPDFARGRAGCDDRLDWCPTATMGLTGYKPSRQEAIR